MSRPVAVLVGPTGVGKSEVACALAERLDAEIISCDSMQVYRRMAVLTQQPTTAQRARVTHHVVDCLEPSETFSAAAFARRAATLIREIRARNKRALLVGGTGLYVRALLDGLCAAPAADPVVRARLVKQGRLAGPEALHAELARQDAVAAAKIQPRDLRRIVRALEVLTISGQPLSQWWRETEGLAAHEAVLQLGLARPRQTLYRRIDERAARMFKEGAIDEVRALRGQPMSHTAQQVLGFGEIVGALEGRYDWTEAERLLARNTRHYARRQLIWFRRDARIRWWEAADAEAPDRTAERLMDAVADAVLEQGA